MNFALWGAFSTVHMQVQHAPLLLPSLYTCLYKKAFPHNTYLHIWIHQYLIIIAFNQCGATALLLCPSPYPTNCFPIDPQVGEKEVKMAAKATTTTTEVVGIHVY